MYLKVLDIFNEARKVEFSDRPGGSLKAQVSAGLDSEAGRRQQDGSVSPSLPSEERQRRRSRLQSSPKLHGSARKDAPASGLRLKRDFEPFQSQHVPAEKHHPGGVRAAGARLPHAPQAGVQGPREQGALHRQKRLLQLGAQEHPRAGPVPAGRLHHAGGPEVALHPRHLHHHLREQLAAVRHELVAGGVRARRPGPGREEPGLLRHRRQVRISGGFHVSEVLILFTLL